MTLITYYGVTTMDKVHECFNLYFRNPSLHQPYTEFTQNMIGIYNRVGLSPESVLNTDSVNYMERYLGNHGTGTELELIKAKNHLTFSRLR